MNAWKCLVCESVINVEKLKTIESRISDRGNMKYNLLMLEEGSPNFECPVCYAGYCYKQWLPNQKVVINNNKIDMSDKINKKVEQMFEKQNKMFSEIIDKLKKEMLKDVIDFLVAKDEEFKK